MSITLTPETQKLLEDRMKKGDYATPDDLVRAALQTLDDVEGEAYEDLDQDTREAIERAEAQAARGEGRPWDDVKAEFRARFLKNG